VYSFISYIPDILSNTTLSGDILSSVILSRCRIEIVGLYDPLDISRKRDQDIRRKVTVFEAVDTRREKK